MVKAGIEHRRAAVEADALPLGQRGGLIGRPFNSLLRYIGMFPSNPHRTLFSVWKSEWFAEEGIKVNGRAATPVSC